MAGCVSPSSGGGSNKMVNLSVNFESDNEEVNSKSVFSSAFFNDVYGKVSATYKIGENEPISFVDGVGNEVITFSPSELYNTNSFIVPDIRLTDIQHLYFVISFTFTNDSVSKNMVVKPYFNIFSSKNLLTTFSRNDGPYTNSIGGNLVVASGESQTFNAKFAVENLAIDANLQLEGALLFRIKAATV